jgi:hypothetical protein
MHVCFNAPGMPLLNDPGNHKHNPLILCFGLDTCAFSSDIQQPRNYKHVDLFGHLDSMAACDFARRVVKIDAHGKGK